MAKAQYTVRDDLWCPQCGNRGMLPLAKSSSLSSSPGHRFRCGNCKLRTRTPSYAPVQVLPKTKVTEIKKHKFFVITSAVNDTPIIKAAHETFKRVALENDGCYLIVPTVYKNPDLMHQGLTGNFTWPTEIIPHICNVNLKLNDNIIVKGETRIQHTVVNPLAGLNHAGSQASEIYAHAQIAMEMIATPKNEAPKMLHTTGTISQPNYGGSVRAQKAKFHHSISAIIIEIEGDKFWPRLIHFDGEGVYDLDRYYTPDGFTENNAVAAIVYGDVHVKFLTEKVESLLKHVHVKLNPEKEIFHDLHDHNTGSHHRVGDVLDGLHKALNGDLNIADELQMMLEYINKHPDAYIIDSNHHRHLDQWFNRFKPQNDPLNSPLYFELAEMARNDMIAGGDANLLRLFAEKYALVKVNFVNCNDSFYIRDIDCSQHGDRGPNGSRGSKKTFAKSGHKTMIGHSHTPGIEKGCYQVGTMTMDLDYAKGLSSWCNTHGIIYDNGKRALFNIIKNKLSPSMRK